MSARPLRTLLDGVRRYIHTDPSNVTPTEVIPVIDDRLIPRVLDLATRIGESLFGVGASAHEVTLVIIQVCRAYGLSDVQVDVTYNSITVSFHQTGEDWPETLMRVVSVAAPDHAKLQRVQALVAEIIGGLDIETARTRFRIIRRQPFLYLQPIVVAARAMLALGVAVMLGATPIIVALSFAAALCAALTQVGLARLRLPLFFSQIAGGFVITAFALGISALGAAGMEPFVDIRPSIIVASGIVLMLAGLTVVGAAQDAIDGFALTAGGRILDLTLQTLGVVIGILLCLELGNVFGISMEPPGPSPLGPFGSVIVGTITVAIAVAVSNGAGFRIVLVSILLSLIAITTYFFATSIGLHQAISSALGALVASFIGVLIAHNLHVPSVAVTTAAIVPLVPGFAVFQGLLQFAQSAGETIDITGGANSFLLAIVVGIGLASGASLGIYLGTPVRATLKGVVKTRARLRR